MSRAGACHPDADQHTAAASGSNLSLIDHGDICVATSSQEALDGTHGESTQGKEDLQQVQKSTKEATDLGHGGLGLERGPL